MNTGKTRRGKEEQTNEAAEIFNKPVSYNKAFAPEQKAEQMEDHSESDALYHHYSDKPSN